jgi:hypothetical protein
VAQQQLAQLLTNQHQANKFKLASAPPLPDVFLCPILAFDDNHAGHQQARQDAIKK